MVYACHCPRSEESGFKPWSRKLCCELHCLETSSFLAGCPSILHGAFEEIKIKETLSLNFSFQP